MFVTASERSSVEPSPAEHRYIKQVGDFMRDTGWTVSEIPTLSNALRTDIKGDNGSYPCLAIVREGTDLFIFYAFSPTGVPEEARPAMAEALARANYSLGLGNFEMDWNDGELRYRTSVDGAGGDLGLDTVRSMIVATVGTFDHYYPALLNVSKGERAPADALAEVEGLR